MRRFLDFWAAMYRNSRALGMAVAIWLAVAVMWGMKCQANRDPVLENVSEKGAVVEYLGGPTADSGNKLRQMVIMLADSTRITLVIMPPLPAVGDRIPLRVEKFKSGKKSYVFDLQEWRISGPG